MSRLPVAAIASRSAKSLASEPEFTRNTVSSGSGSMRKIVIAELEEAAANA